MTIKMRPQCKRKLEPYQITHIRLLHEIGYNQKSLALMFNVGPSSIRKIVNFSTYKDII